MKQRVINPTRTLAVALLCGSALGGAAVAVPLLEEKKNNPPVSPSPQPQVKASSDIRGDDYPYKNSDCKDASEGAVSGVTTPLGTMACQCTDFVLWRLNQNAGGDAKNIKFGKPDGQSLYASDYPGVFRSFPENTDPQVGDVAVINPNNHDSGEYGHVAYVAAVDNAKKTVTVEQYNWSSPASNFKGLSYSQETHPQDYYDLYIHIGQHPKPNR